MTYYVDSTRTVVDLATAVTNGVATKDIWQLIDAGTSAERSEVFAVNGGVVGDFQLAAAEADAEAGPVPAAVVPPAPTPVLKGATAERPDATKVPAGRQFYDTTLHKPVWSDGTAWKDATGTAA